MPMLLLLLLFDDGKSVKAVNVEELWASFVVSSYHHGDEAAFSAFQRTPGTVQGKIGIFHVDLKTNIIHMLDDARLDHLHGVAWVGGELVIFSSRFDKFVKLDEKLLFKDQVKLANLLGEKELPGTLKYISPFKGEANLISFMDKGQAVLGVFDKSKFTAVASYSPGADEAAFWIYTDRKILLIEPERGRIQLVNEKFTPVKIIHKGDDLVESFNSDLSYGGRQIGLTKYRTLLPNPLVQPRFVNCSRNQYFDAFGNELKQPSHSVVAFNSSGPLKVNPVLEVIVANEQNQLVFNIQEGDFHFAKIAQEQQ